METEVLNSLAFLYVLSRRHLPAVTELVNFIFGTIAPLGSTQEWLSELGMLPSDNQTTIIEAHNLLGLEI